MQQNNHYTFDSKVRFSEVDHTGRITLPGIINYFQDCSTFQSESIGLGVDYFAEHNRAWVLTYWQVVIEEYPRLAQEINIATWATEFKSMLGKRNFCMTDAEGKKLAYANSVWAYMDMKKGRPVRPFRRRSRPVRKRRATGDGLSAKEDKTSGECGEKRAVCSAKISYRYERTCE